MSKRLNWARAAVLLLAAGLLAFGVAACGGDDDGDDGETTAATFEPDHNVDFFDREEMDRQLAWRDEEPEDFGAGDQPWEQAIEPELVDTSEYQTDGPWNVCFSNASVDNPWRVVGWETMQAQVDELGDQIANFRAIDAEAGDDKQISDIQTLTRGNCDALIVSPNTTATLTPAVEQACETGIPVIVFDRGVDTDCQVTFIKPIGGYAFGADAAEFLADNVEEGGKILALRILPGVDVLETRWSAAQEVFSDAGLDIVGDEFTEGDAANTKQIIDDYLAREGSLDGVWMDAGAVGVAAAEAFEDAGQEVPPITGEDQLDFLRKWQDDDLTAIAPTYPTYQWRTPIIAATRILSGEQVPSQWNLPQPAITDADLDEYISANEGLPPLHYALCGCEELPGFPGRWGG